MSDDNKGHPKESSVIFSLKELKRISPKTSAPQEAQAAPVARTSHKAFDPDDDQSDQLVTEALSSLKERVDAEQRRLREAKEREAEQRRITLELARLEEEGRQLELALAKATQDREVVETRVRAVERELAPPAPPVPSFADLEPERPRGVVLSPVALGISAVLILGAFGGLGAYLATRKPLVNVVTRPVPTAGVARPPAFGPELTWLDVGDKAVAPARKDDDDGEKSERPRAAAAPVKEAAARPLSLPSRPADGGFVY